MAGGKAPADTHSKANLWRTLTRLKEMPVYSTLRETLRASIEDDKVTLAAHVAMAIKVLQDAQYTELNTVAAEKALAAKDTSTDGKAAARKKEFAAKRKQHENTPVGDNRPFTLTQELRTRGVNATSTLGKDMRKEISEMKAVVRNVASNLIYL